MAIQSFGNPGTEDIYNGIDSKHARKVPKELWARVRRKLDAINAAESLHDLKAPPSNQLEELKKDRPGFHSIRVNDQYRIIFRFVSGNATDVTCEDPH